MPIQFIITEAEHLSGEQREALAAYLLYGMNNQVKTNVTIDPKIVFTKQAEPSAEESFGSEDPAATPPAVDATGYPWDERIHSASRGLTEQGVWRKRRGVSQFEIEKVEAELRALTANKVVEMPSKDEAPEPPAAEAPEPPAADEESGDNGFEGLVDYVQESMESGKLTKDELEKVVKDAGVERLPLLQKENAEKVKAVKSAIGKILLLK